ncbi:MAG: DUF302 domain-containing protein [Pseudomonadota bacterium]
MTRLIALILAGCCGLPAWAADAPRSAPAPIGRWLDFELTPYGPLLIQRGPPPPYRDYQMSRVLTPDERKRWRAAAMPMMERMMQMDAREVINQFALKMKARPGLSFDDVVQSLTLRANRLNLKYVGNNALWQDFRAVLGDDKAPRTEVLSFCDIALARELLRVIPELVVFMPCRIAVMEDADRNVWVLMLDWDITWLEQAGKAAGMTPDLRRDVSRIREKMESVMRAGANGEL